MAAKNNIVYFLLDSDNNPTQFAAIDSDGGAEWIDEDNLDPQTKNVRTGFADVSGDITSNTGQVATNTAAIAVLDDDVDFLGTLSGDLVLSRGGGTLSAVDVCSTGDGTVDNAVPTFKMGPNKIAWTKPVFTLNSAETQIQIDNYWGDNLTANFTTGGVANIIASGVEAKSLETNTFTSDNVTASAFALVVGAVSACPVPPPFAYIQLTSDDAASSDEKQIGYSNTPVSYTSNTDHIAWDDTNKNFEVSAAGMYECVARVFFEGGSTLIEMHVRKNNAAQNTANPRAHTTVDPVERTISCIFSAAIGDTIDVTYEATSAQTTAAQIGTTVTVKRLQ